MNPHCQDLQDGLEVGVGIWSLDLFVPLVAVLSTSLLLLFIISLALYWGY